MGANAFNQYVLPYLMELRGWSDAGATMVLVIGFGSMPILRYYYAHVHRFLSDRGALVIGHLLFTLYMVIIMVGDGLWAVLAAGLSLAAAAALVFTAGPLQIIDATPGRLQGWTSGLFYSSNFLAWLLGNLLYSGVIQAYGFEFVPITALFLTLIGLLGLTLVPRRTAERRIIPWQSQLELLQSKSLRMMVVLMALSAFSLGLMFGPFAQLIALQHGPALLSTLVLGFYLARLPGSLLAGLIVTHLGERRLLVFTFSAAALGLWLASWQKSIFAIAAVMILLGFQQAATPVAATALVGSSDQRDHRHHAHGLAFSASNLGIAIALLLSSMVGLAVDLGAVLAIFGVIFAAGALVAAGIKSSSV
jgi:predicted MFS family arabinose efflux permease